MKFIRLAKAFSLGITILSFSSAFAADTARDIVLLMANSERMQTYDPQSLTRKAITKFLQTLHASTRVAIVIYDERIQRIAPLLSMDATNTNRLRKQLNAIIPHGRHRNHAAGLERAIYELKTKGRGEAQKMIIFLNDGPIDTGERTQDLDFAKWLREILAQEAADAGIRVYGIAFTENADIQSVQTLTYKTSGSYYRAFTAEDIQPAFIKIQSALRGDVAQTSTPARPRPLPPPPLLEQTVPPRQPPATATAPQSAFTQEGFKTDSQFEIARNRAEETLTTLQTTPLPLPASPQRTPPTPSKVPLPEQKNSAGYEFPTHFLLLALFIVLGLAGLSIVVFFIMRKPHAARHTPPTRQSSSDIYTAPGLLEDVNGITNLESHDISGKLTWISRAAHGADSANVRTIVINDELISRDHAFIQYKNSGYWLLDCGSANGTYVNGERIYEEKLLKHGDQIRFAKFEFKFLTPQRDDLAKTVMARVTAAPQSSLSADTSESTVANPTLSPTKREVSSSHVVTDDHHEGDAYDTIYENALGLQEAKHQHRSRTADDTIIADPQPAKNRSKITQLSPSIENHVGKGRQIRKSPISVGNLKKNHAGSRIEYLQKNKGIRTEDGSGDSAQLDDTEELVVDTRLNIESSSVDRRDDPDQQAEKRDDTEELLLEDIDQTILISPSDDDDDEKTGVTPTKSPNIGTSADQGRAPPPDDSNKTVIRPIDK
jgi:pSer/pThr/pTyr-binding forkhead associated (FHA) protein